MVRPLTREPLGTDLCDSASGSRLGAPVSYWASSGGTDILAMILKKVYEAATLARCCLLWIWLQ